MQLSNPNSRYFNESQWNTSRSAMLTRNGAAFATPGRIVSGPAPVVETVAPVVETVAPVAKLVREGGRPSQTREVRLARLMGLTLAPLTLMAREHNVAGRSKLRKAGLASALADLGL